MKRVLIGIPTARSVDALCLSGVIDTLTNSTVAEFRLETVMGCYVNVNRNRIVQAAKDGGFDEVLFVDSDMAVTRPQIERLLQHDVDIVGAVYAKRIAGAPQWTLHYNDGAKVGDGGLLPVNDIGAGVLRVRMRVFDAIYNLPERRYVVDGQLRGDYFPVGIYGSEYLGEDVYFCRLAQSCGFQVWADTHCLVGHIGSATFPLEVAPI